MMQRPTVRRRNTRQRDVIVRVIREASGPLTVPEIHQRAQAELPELGIATVYRAVKELREADNVQPVVLPTGETRFEPSGRGHHHHFHCRVCDRVYDVETCPVRVPASHEIEAGFVVERHELTLYGVCPKCG
jgi:Fur family ferric uptake transcriptional regulator